MLISYQVDLESDKFITREEIRVMLKRLAKVKRVKFIKTRTKSSDSAYEENYVYPKFE